MTESPFTKADISAMRRMAAALKDCQGMLERAKRAGIQCDDYCAKCEELIQAYNRMIEEYGKVVRS